MPSLPTVHVLHVDGNVLEITNSNDSSGVVAGTSGGPGGSGTTSSSTSTSITSQSGNYPASNGNNTFAASPAPSTGGVAGGVSGSSVQPTGGGVMAATVATGSLVAVAAADSTTTHISIARPLISPPTVSGIGCAPLQEEPGVVAGTKNRLNITSVINNSNLGNRKNHYTNNSSSVMTHKTQMQMALQRKINNLTLKQLHASHGTVGTTVGAGIEHSGLLAEGIAVRGKQSHSNVGISSGGGALSNNKRLQVVLPSKESEYAVRKGMCTPERLRGHDEGEISGSALSSPVSTTTATYSPLLPSSGFSSPLVSHKYSSAVKTPNTNLSSGSRTASTPPSTSGSGGFNDYCGVSERNRGHNQEGFDGMLMIDADNACESVPTSESCSPHVRLCGSRASCGPMWTNEDLTMLDLVYNNGNGTTPSSGGNIGSKSSDALMVVGSGEMMSSSKPGATTKTAAKKKLLVGDEGHGDEESSSRECDNHVNLRDDNTNESVDNDGVHMAVQAMKALHLPQLHDEIGLMTLRRQN